MLLRVRHRYIGWIAIAFVFLSALAPSVSRAIAAESLHNFAWQQVCSMQGGSRVALVNSPEAPDQGDMDDHANHCTYCLIDPVIWGPPSQLVNVVRHSEGGPVYLTVGVSPIRPRLPWITPHTRAPPLFS